MIEKRQSTNIDHELIGALHIFRQAALEVFPRSLFVYLKPNEPLRSHPAYQEIIGMFKGWGELTLKDVSPEIKTKAAQRDSEAISRVCAREEVQDHLVKYFVQDAEHVAHRVGIMANEMGLTTMKEGGAQILKEFAEAAKREFDGEENREFAQKSWSEYQIILETLAALLDISKQYSLVTQAAAQAQAANRREGRA